MFRVSKVARLKLPAGTSPFDVLPWLSMEFDAEWWPQVISVERTSANLTLGTTFHECSYIIRPVLVADIKATVVEFGGQPDGTVTLALRGKGTGLEYKHRYTVTKDASELHWESEVYLPVYLLPLQWLVRRVIDRQLEDNLPLLVKFIERKFGVA